ncbi:methyltransferase, FkbM family [Pseudomonas flavescens]|uniref:Methyltransferase, FkbM family n=1 Tax=Phytopseudomonas flavescens TaxID=29435 RepID=A0A1G8J940_9GAMM|nr:FkbM family methyltransferase [Pseudomonas flavescens]SDI27716.1 methyltransferase, FkbM family [Pseudomonas flavescens]
MNDSTRNPLLAARSQLADGELDKQGYCAAINGHHAQLFDYPAFLAGTDVAGIQISAEGVTVSSARHGISMFVDAVDLHATPYALLGFGSYENDETAFLKSVFGEGEVFLDVGANLGWYSLVLGRQCPQGRIFAFEPIPSTVAVLERNIRLNRLTNVEPVAMGLFDRQDELGFFFAEDVSGATSLKMAGQDRGRAPVREVRCRTTTLDAFCASRALQPSLIKIDVEGAELMVVQGGERTLQATPIILVELLRKWSRVFGYHPNDVFTHLAGHGYQAWAFVGDGSGKLQACAAVTEQTVQTNFVFLHPHKHAHVISQWQAN